MLTRASAPLQRCRFVEAEEERTYSGAELTQTMGGGTIVCDALRIEPDLGALSASQVAFTEPSGAFTGSLVSNAMF